MSKDKVSIIILNYNGGKIIRKCLESVYKQRYGNFEVIVVDNGSTDGSLTEISKKFPKVKIVKSHKNLGFAQGNNFGYKKAKGDLILFLNNDKIVDRNFLSPLVEKITSSSEIGAIQPKILQFPNKYLIDSVGSYFILTGFLYHFGHNKKDQKKYNSESYIFSMKGACMLFKREVLKNTGLFDKDYFAYFEETDLCQRTWISGYKVLYLPSSKIYHMGGETVKNISGSFIQYHSYKNRIYTYLKNLDAKTIIKIVPLHIFLCELISLLYLFTFKFSLFAAVQKAILWNIYNLPRLKNERIKIERIRRVRDEEYLANLTRKVKPSYYYHLFFTSLTGYKD